MINKIHFESANSGLHKLGDETVDICVCSPPYKEKDGYNNSVIETILDQTLRVLKNNSLLFINFGHLAGFKDRPFDVVKMAINQGFQFQDTIIWIKNHYKPIQGNKRLNNLFEYIFMFSKGDMPRINRLAIGVSYVCKSNAKRFANGRDLRCGGNIWHINYKTITNKSQKPHPDIYPVELPERCVKLSGIPKGSIVLDPFMGHGTSAIAALNLGMSYIGFEKNEDYYNLSLKRIEEYQKQNEINHE